MIKLSIQEFRDIEIAVGMLDTDGTEDLRIGRFDDGEVGLAVERDGESAVLCRLRDWMLEARNPA